MREFAARKVEEILHEMVDEVSLSLELPRREAYFLALDLLCGVLGLSRSLCIIQARDRILTKEEAEVLQGYLQRLIAHEPLQYILGEAPFADLRLEVSKGVLIPRPETEELCVAIQQEWEAQEKLHFLDIGAGSGAIVLYLAKHFTDSRGYALENSPMALPLLRRNVERISSELGSSRVEVIAKDLFSPKEIIDLLPPLDIVVSNPPYVLQEEREEIAEHVLRFEPEEALFTPLGDPLHYYKGIIQLCENLHFRKGAMLYVEINAKLSRETFALFSSDKLFDKVVLLPDLSQKERFIKATIRS